MKYNAHDRILEYIRFCNSVTQQLASLCSLKHRPVIYVAVQKSKRVDPLEENLWIRFPTKPASVS